MSSPARATEPRLSSPAAGSSPPGPPSRTAALASQALTAAWARGALPYPSLAPDDLIRAASTAEKRDDFAGETWRPALDVLAGALECEARLSPLGRAMAHGQLVKALRERLRAVALLARHPEIADIPLPRPIVVLGPMRSGTTRMQRLLACDPRLAHTRTFESLSPVPGRGGKARRVAATALGLAVLRQLNPAIARIHPTTAMAPEEEFGWFNPSLLSAQFVTQWDVPSYAAWAARADRADAYKWFRLLLQINAWARGQRTPAPWILKAPEFMDGLDCLLAAFPDARLLCLRRDASQVVPSAASLTFQHRRLHSDHACPRATGLSVLALVRRRDEATAAVRARLPGQPQLEVQYTALDQDWRGAMRRVYAWLEMPLTAPVERRMASYLGRAHAHRGHRYSAAEFGLDQGDIAAALPSHG